MSFKKRSYVCVFCMRQISQLQSVILLLVDHFSTWQIHAFFVVHILHFLRFKNCTVMTVPFLMAFVNLHVAIYLMFK